MSTTVSDNYLPSIERRREIILTQIEEAKTIIYRNTLEIAEGQAGNQEDKVVAGEHNIKQLTRKVDVMLDLLEKLGN